MSEPPHIIECGASRYTALAVPAPLESGDFPSTAWSSLSSSRSSHRKKTDIGITECTQREVVFISLYLARAIKSIL